MTEERVAEADALAAANLSEGTDRVAELEQVIEQKDVQIEELTKRLQTIVEPVPSSMTLIGACLKKILTEGIDSFIDAGNADGPLSDEEQDLIKSDLQIIENYEKNFGIDHVTISILTELRSKEVLRTIIIYADIMSRGLGIQIKE